MGTHVAHTSEAMVQLTSRALNSEYGIGILFPTHGAAVNWRQRYYRVRAREIARGNTEWQTLTAVIGKPRADGQCELMLCPSDAHLLQYEIRELEGPVNDSGFSQETAVNNTIPESSITKT